MFHISRSRLRVVVSVLSCCARRIIQIPVESDSKEAVDPVLELTPNLILTLTLMQSAVHDTRNDGAGRRNWWRHVSAGYSS